MNKLLYSESRVNIILLIIRILIGSFMIMSGIPAFTKENYITTMAGKMSEAGLGFFGETGMIFAKLTELIGGLFIVLGFLTRPAAFALSVVMFTAVIFHINLADNKFTFPMILMGIFIFITIMAAGKYSIDKILFAKK